jgi:aryl-alcohol dehydrogenase-like predicted oxidoreductase
MFEMRKLSIQSSDGKILLSRLILGTANFGTGIGESDSFSFLDTYFRLGGTSLDTAGVYGDWEGRGTPVSEQVIGRWLRSSGVRSQVEIITKGAHYNIKHPEISRVSPKCIAEDVEKSLNALQTDCIDVYFLHRDNPSVPAGELIETLNGFIRAGKIRAIGASNWTVKRIREANAYAEKKGLVPFTSSEIEWSLAHISPEHDEFADLPHMTPEDYPEYLKMGMPVLAWTAQSYGVIPKVLQNGPESLKPRTRDKFYNEITKRRIENVRAVCARTGIKPMQAVLAYITCNPLPGAAILGASSLGQLLDSMSAADLELDGAVIRELEQ